MAKKKWVFWKDNSPHTKLTVNPAMLSGAMSLDTLVRELTQNSADAVTDDGKVKIVVSDGYVESAAVYGPLCLEDLKAHIQGTIDFAEKTGGEKRIVPKSLGQLDLLKQPKYRYLKFSDYGTKGMRGISSYDEKMAFWKLLFQEGTSDKSSNSAGGVGVGKNATFPFSDLATVFYITKNDEGFGFAGSAHLASSVIDNQNYQTDGNLISYSSEDEDILDKRNFSTIKPLDEEDADEMGLDLFKRTENGSDVIILGTDSNTRLSDKEWPYLFATSAIKNFFVAFLNDKIELTIKHEGIPDIVISKDTCKTVLDDISAFGDSLSSDLAMQVNDAKLALETYLGKPDDPDYAIVTRPDDGLLGEVKLYLNRSKDVTYKEWCVCRSFGMRTITSSARVQRPVFAIAVISSKEGSDYLLKAEAGNHTEYDIQALGDQKDSVKKEIGNLESWIKNEISSFGKIDTSTTDIELAGFSNFICLEDSIKTGEENGGTKPLMELQVHDSPIKRRARKVRKRDTKEPDQDLQKETAMSGTEQWNHNPDSHHNWDHERSTQGQVEGNKPASTYARVVNVLATIRDVHESYGDQAEIIGIVKSQSYKQIDITVSAVDEQSKINSNLPPIIVATDHDSGATLEIVGGYLIKDVPVNDLGYVHVDVKFGALFRAVLLETASTRQNVAVQSTDSVKNDAEGGSQQ
jgi:hypothetical protein